MSNLTFKRALSAAFTLFFTLTFFMLLAAFFLKALHGGERAWSGTDHLFLMFNAVIASMSLFAHTVLRDDSEPS